MAAGSSTGAWFSALIAPPSRRWLTVSSSVWLKEVTR